MMEFHPLANLFPLIEGEAFAELVEDVRRHGVRERIVLLDGKILDGRNRYRAAVEAGVLNESEERLTREKRFGDGAFMQTASQFAAFSSVTQGDPLDWVLSKNLHRRHLSASQLAMVAADLGKLRQGRPSEWKLPSSAEEGKPASLRDKPQLTASQRADLVGVSERQVQTADHVKEHAAPEVVDAVRRGEVKVSAAAEIASLPVTEQLEILRGADPRAFSRIARERRQVQQAAKRERRDEREASLGAHQQALPDKRYGVILADPEWQFVTWGENGMDRAADNHYPTSPLEVIAARDVAGIAADDCVLLLWATVPMHEQAFAVMRAWGFTPKTEFIGVKDRVGTGYWNRNKHEILMLGTRGNVPAPAMGTQFDSVLPFPVGVHSEKPGFAHEIAEAYFPSLPKIELNARARRDGWDAWGLEAPDETTVECAPVEPAETQAGDGNGFRLKGNATLAQPGVGVRDNGALAEALRATQREDGASPAPPSPAVLPSDAINQIIRDGYAAGGPQLIARLAAATGLKPDAVKQRAKTMKLSSRERQREAVALSNRTRAAKGAPAAQEALQNG